VTTTEATLTRRTRARTVTIAATETTLAAVTAAETALAVTTTEPTLTRGSGSRAVPVTTTGTAVATAGVSASGAACAVSVSPVRGPVVAPRTAVAFAGAVFVTTGTVSALRS
ncbi:hypothetical protein ACFYPU_29580, partial [Micromonospora profundi]